MQRQLHSLNMTPVSMEQLRATLWQKSIKTQNVVRDKTGNSLKTIVQTISKYQQVWRFKSHVCISWKRGWNIPSYNNRDSNGTKEISPDLFKRMQKHQSGFAFSAYWRHNSDIYRWKSIISSSLWIGQSLGSTITSSTLATHILKRQWDPWYTGKVYIISSGHKMNLANLTKNKRYGLAPILSWSQ